MFGTFSKVEQKMRLKSQTFWFILVVKLKRREENRKFYSVLCMHQMLPKGTWHQT